MFMYKPHDEVYIYYAYDSYTASYVLYKYGTIVCVLYVAYNAVTFISKGYKLKILS